VLERLFARGTDGSLPRFAAEVVSADSMQVYRGMDIGTAKPDASLRDRLPHHLIDIRNPDESFNAGDFVRLADEACLGIAGRGRIPVVSGGTGFYLKNFALGLSQAPPSDPAIRAALSRELEEKGADALMAELREADPASAARIHVNDAYRVMRALEVFRVSSRPLSSFAMNGRGAASDRPGYRILAIALERERAEIYRRIDERAAAMFRAGLPLEVAALREAGYGNGDPAMRAIGYAEFFLPDGSLSDRLDEVQRLVARNSRHYAKRQILFFSSIPGVRRLRAGDDGEELASLVAAELEAFLAEDGQKTSGLDLLPSLLHNR